MTDNIDIVVKDTGTTTAIKNIEQLGTAADGSAKSIKGLQDALKLVSRGEFQKAKNGLAQASSNLASAQRDAAAAASTLTTAQTRGLVNEQKVLLARQKVSTETARTQVQMAKLAVETQRAATLSAAQALAEDRLSSAQERRAAAATKLAAAQASASTATQAAAKATQAASAGTTQFTGEQKKLAGAAEANRMHMVNVSYQLQDIAVGLASGQRPMTVFIQQGAQLYGIAQMMNVSLGQLAKQIAVMSGRFLANPFVLLSVAVVGAGLAIERYTSMQKDFNSALMTTNNYIGQTKDNFDSLAKSISGASNTSFATAAEAMTAVAASGKIAGAQFEQISIIAARMQATVGTAVSDTVATYAELGKAPLETLLKLNQTERFLTLEQYKRIKALEDEGQKQLAVADAIEIYLANQNKMADAVERARGPAAQMWADIKKGTSDATSALGEYLVQFANMAAVQSKMSAGVLGNLYQWSHATDKDQARGFMANAQGFARGAVQNVMSGGKSGNQSADLEELTRRYNENRAAVEASQKAEQSKLISQEQNKQSLREYQATLDKTIARDLERVKITQLVAATGLKGAEAQAKINSLLAQYDEKNKTKAPKGPSDGSSEMLARLQKQIVLNDARVESEKRLTETQRLLAETQDYLNENNGKLSASTVAAIKAKMELARTSGEAKEAADNEYAAKQRLLALTAALNKEEANQLAGYDLDYKSLTMDKTTLDAYKQRLEIDNWYASELDKLRLDTIAKDEKSRKAQEDALRASYDRRIQNAQEAAAKMAEANASWSIGMQGAMRDYVEQTKNDSTVVKDFLTNAFKAAEDALVRFATTGKLSFSDLANSIIADMARIAIQKGLAGMMGGPTPSANGNVFSGGSGLSDSSNRVVNGYRTFQFANGGAFDHNGSMAERGAEAIMPLQRDSSGRLGVKSTGGIGTGAPKVNIVVYGGEGKEADSQASMGKDGELNIEIFLDAAEKRVAQGISTGQGPAYSSIKRRFNVGDR